MLSSWFKAPFFNSLPLLLIFNSLPPPPLLAVRITEERLSFLKKSWFCFLSRFSQNEEGGRGTVEKIEILRSFLVVDKTQNTKHVIRPVLYFVFCRASGSK